MLYLKAPLLHILPQALLRAFFWGSPLKHSSTQVIKLPNYNISAAMAEIQHYMQGAKIPSKRKGYGFTNKCASLVKEQRGRLYILRRCATMLLCWYIQGDD